MVSGVVCGVRERGAWCVVGEAWCAGRCEVHAQSEGRKARQKGKTRGKSEPKQSTRSSGFVDGTRRSQSREESN